MGVVATSLIGGRHLGIAIVIRPVLTVGITVTAVTSSFKRRGRSMGVATDTVCSRVVTGIAFAAAVEVINISIVVAGLANTGEISFPVTCSGGAISEVFHRSATDIGFDHGIEIILTVRVVTSHAVQAVGTGIASGVKVNVHAPGMTIVTEIIPLTDHGKIMAANIIEAVGISQDTTDMGGSLCVTVGASAVRCRTSRQTVANCVIGGAGAAWGGNTTDNSQSAITMTGFTADAGRNRPVIFSGIGGSVATVTQIAAVDGIVGG